MSETGEARALTSFFQLLKLKMRDAVSLCSSSAECQDQRAAESRGPKMDVGTAECVSDQIVYYVAPPL